eukprot:3726438-Rhodomonas_salina.1
MEGLAGDEEHEQLAKRLRWTGYCPPHSAQPSAKDDRHEATLHTSYQNCGCMYLISMQTEHPRRSDTLSRRLSPCTLNLECVRWCFITMQPFTSTLN